MKKDHMVGQLQKENGLTTDQAIQKLHEIGPNEILPTKLESGFSEFMKIIMNPMGLMLLSLSGLYALMGDKTDALVLLVAFIPITAVDVILELRSSRALKALKNTISPTAKLMRDNIIKEVPIREIVPGDVILFEEGQALPADGQILSSENLLINESALTGESLPIEKPANEAFWGGTIVLQGRGTGLVTHTGKASKFGKITQLLGETFSDKSPLRKKVDQIVRKTFFVALGLALFLLFVEFQRTHQLAESIIIALTFGMAAIPEEFPLVYTLYLSMGAWRLAKHGVLVKSLPSVEALGGVDVICTDKTGTLTEGRFQLEDTKILDPQCDQEFLWRSALMACEPHPIDAMELAIYQKAESFQDSLKGWHLTWDYPFESSGKHMSHVWKNEQSGQYMIVMKGAVEGVVEHCSLDQQGIDSTKKIVESIAATGKRILALAARVGICTGQREQDETSLNFLGILVFSDPIRPSVKPAIQACQKAGIEIKMLTGDHPMTAHAVADEVGLEHSHEHLYTGKQLATLSAEQRQLAYLNGAIFSRVLPEQKHEMIRVLKASGKTVAMTGDGINDAPALKLADIGISMGKNATDVARSTAKMVLLNNDFSGIVEAVFEGRKIFSNLSRSFSYLVAFHVPVILLALIPPILGIGKLLLPIHIILLELIVHPISAFAFENIENQKSKIQRKSLLTTKQFVLSASSGLLLSLASVLIFAHQARSSGLESARAAAFGTVLFGNIFFVLAEMWPIPTKRFYLISTMLILMVIAINFSSKISELLHFHPIGIETFFISLLIGAICSLPSFAGRKT